MGLEENVQQLILFLIYLFTSLTKLTKYGHMRCI